MNSYNQEGKIKTKSKTSLQRYFCGNELIMKKEKKTDLMRKK